MDPELVPHAKFTTREQNQGVKMLDSIRGSMLSRVGKIGASQLLNRKKNTSGMHTNNRLSLPTQSIGHVATDGRRMLATLARDHEGCWIQN